MFDDTGMKELARRKARLVEACAIDRTRALAHGLVLQSKAAPLVGLLQKIRLGMSVARLFASRE